MKKILISALLCVLALSGCTTKDVPFVQDDPNNYYEITDAAFAEYMIYNSTLASTDANALPAEVCFKQDDKYFIDKRKAAAATSMYLVKSNAAMDGLEAAGVPLARVKIVSIDGIQFFTSLKELKLTSNTITGSLDLSMLTKLETVEMNSNYVNALLVPASLVKLNYNASTSSSAPDNRWLTQINFSACSKLNSITLTNHKITAGNFIIPTVYTDLREITMTGNTGAPFPIPAALYNQLTTRVGVSSL